MKILSILFFSLSISSVYADTFEISKFMDNKLIESKEVYRTTNFASIYNIDFKNHNALLVKINDTSYNTQSGNVNKLEINSSDKFLNLMIYNLNGDIVQNKAINEFIPWGNQTEMSIFIMPTNCSENCNSYNFTIKKQQ